jgi:hypothetical protein
MNTAAPAFRLSVPQPAPRLAFGEPDPEPVDLTEKYRPQTLAEMVGQGLAVWQIQTFLEAPHSHAFLFEGTTGSGKTTAAKALAAELGVSEFNGLDVIKSGTQDAEAVEWALRSLRFSTGGGSGWKVVVVDEADNRSAKADQLWLSALEDLPPRRVIVFTTNHPEKFHQRFLDRCERIRFESNPALLFQDAQALAGRIWRAELGRDDCPPVERLPNLIERGELSFRRVVRGLEPIIRHVRRTGDLPALPRAAEIAPRGVPTHPPDVPVVHPLGDPQQPTAPDGDDEGREPCLDCGTRQGGRTASGKIERTKGRCQSCYNRYRRTQGATR